MFVEAKSEVLLTSREFLYHLPCSYSARKLDCFGGGWPIAQRTMRSWRIVALPPAFHEHLCFVERLEQFPLEPLIPDSTSGFGWGRLQAAPIQVA